MAMADSTDHAKELEILLGGHQQSLTLRAPDIAFGKTGTASPGTSVIPVIEENVCYVVAAVVFNERGQVLLTREGFYPCYGKWYLPAGRVDPLETLQQAAVREVREETGLIFNATSVAVIEQPSASWLRFTFTGTITGGSLRTLDDADDETLEAGWWDVDKVLTAPATGKNTGRMVPAKSFELRGPDIIPLIQKVQRLQEAGTTEPPLLPTLVPLSKLLVRPLLIAKNVDGYSVVCVGESEEKHLPVIDTGMSTPNAVHAIRVFAKNTLQVAVGSLRVCGVIGIEHDGRQAWHDGLCLTVLVEMTAADAGPLPKLHDKRFTWSRVGGGDGAGGAAAGRLTQLCEKRLAPDSAVAFLY